MEKKRTILLSNDDGYDAPGIGYLYDALSGENNVIIVAPDQEQSGVGHAFTYNRPLHYEKYTLNDGNCGYKVSGSPADCVKFAVSYLLEQRPDVVVSGMNIGENSGLSSFYSGTVAAAREGAFWNIPSVAFSTCKECEPYAEEYAAVAARLLNGILESLPQINDNKVYYNVNFPPCSPQKVLGTRITWQSRAFFEDRYERIEVESHHTKEGFLVYGEKKDIEISNAFDSRALINNYIAVTPLMYDATAHAVIPHLQWLEKADLS